MWWSRYLMDYDPLNQLLVCMVCGEQRYGEGPEAARIHIEEAHPETLSLDQQQRWRLQQAWEEQVAQREQFFSSQLQQHTATTTQPGEGGGIHCSALLWELLPNRMAPWSCKGWWL